MRIAFTGARDVLRADLPTLVEQLKLLRVYPFDEVHSGGAMGLDTLAAAAFRKHPNHTLHIPAAYQHAALLKVFKNNDWQEDFDLLDSRMCWKCGPVTHTPYRFQERNEHMVDNADRIYTYYRNRAGGTDNCIRYALRVGKPVIDLLTGERITAI